MTNTHINIGGHKVSAGKVYSTSEVKTGDVWIDGKPIYRKAFKGTLNSYKSYTASVSDLNIDLVINGNFTLYQITSPYKYNINNWYNSSSDCARLLLANNKADLQVSGGTGLNEGDVVVAWIEYTKTTD